MFIGLFLSNIHNVNFASLLRAFSRQPFINRLGAGIYSRKRPGWLDKVFLPSVNSFVWEFVG
jgi:hypothetical protein